jgi:holin-like protein
MPGFAILLLFNLVGYFLCKVVRIPLPPNVLGLVCLFLALQTGVVKLSAVEETAQLLLRHMMLFFAPIIVGVVVFFPLIAKQWLPISVGLIGSTLFVLVLTGMVVTRLTTRSKGARS